jgi:hypothetical protein
VCVGEEALGCETGDAVLIGGYAVSLGEGPAELCVGRWVCGWVGEVSREVGREGGKPSWSETHY